MMSVEKILALTIPAAAVGAVFFMVSCNMESDRLAEPRRMVEAQRSIECIKAGGNWLYVGNSPACLNGRAAPVSER